MDSLVSTDWLARELGGVDLRVVDATFFALDPTRDPAADHAGGHIPGALFLDLASLKDAANPLPSMLPPADAFAARMARLGMDAADRIILYDDTPHRTATRAWWIFRAFGFLNVAVLDGGLAKWKAEGRPIEGGAVRPTASGSPPDVRLNAGMVRTLAQMRQNLAEGTEQVVDARGAPRFTGAESDPRGLADGHMPGSRNLPYDRLFEADGTWKRDDALRAAFEAAGVDLARPLVTTCGSGITAAVVLFGAHLLGKGDVALYDGSWSEWGALPDTPKAVGAA